VCATTVGLTCPVLRVKNNDVIITNGIIDRLTNSTLEWNDLLTNCYIPESVIEYIDPDEQNLSMIAMKSKIDNLSNFNYRYTHVRYPSTIFGILASCIPFPSPTSRRETCIRPQ
jgi:hypothetical protein